MEEKKPTNYFIVTVILIVVVAIAVYFVMINRPFREVHNPITQTETLEYVNTQYGFNFTLPASWEGYVIVEQNWTGNPIDVQNAPSITGPEIFIRHPLWTAISPRQDIPIMVFTLAEWDQILGEKLSVSAAPIGPSELGRNSKYVFALPARYNFAYQTGFEEVQTILDSKPLKAI